MQIQKEIGQLARQWAKENYPYHMIANLSERVKAFARHPEPGNKISSRTTISFLMTAALHSGGDWYYWVDKNRKNPEVLDHLMRLVFTGYDRPAWRVMYALQSFMKKEVQIAISKAKGKVTPDILKAFSDYVYSGKVFDYLMSIKKSHDPDKAKKADIVIREITSFCKTAPQFGVNETKRVFISYNHKDRSHVLKIKRIVKAANINVIIDIEALSFGDNIKEFIERAVKESDFTISVISKNSLLSPWVFLEALETMMHERVQGKTKYLPIVIDKQMFGDHIHGKAVQKIDKGIRKLNNLIYEQANQFVLTTTLDSKRSRLIDLRNNLDRVLLRLSESLYADCTTDAMMVANLRKLAKQIQEK